MTTLTHLMHKRYSTKAYDSSRKIPAEMFAEIENVLHLSPTSTNLQPLHFIVAESDAGKARIAKGSQGNFAFNAEKILNASHVVLVASKVFADDAHLEQVLEQEFQDGRYANEEEKVQRGKARRGFVELHRHQINDEAHWHAKQAYIALGSALMTAAQLGIDATPIEGIDTSCLDAEFGLTANGYATQFVIAFGYHHDSDFNAKLPKSRLPKATVMEKI